jgi:penicillin-binding protein 1A
VQHSAGGKDLEQRRHVPKMPPGASSVQPDPHPDTFRIMAGPTSSRWARFCGFWRNPRNLRVIGLGAVAAVLFGGMLVLGIWTRACAGDSCPAINKLSGADPDQASKVYAADGRLIGDFGLQRRTVISLASMSPAVPAAFLAVEDKRFYEHHGIDWVRCFGIVRSLLKLQGLSQGCSTITMQLVGNLYPDQIDRTERKGIAGIKRKIREMKVAMQLESQFKKDKILELYLNYINLGNGAFGVEAAAQRYFGKSAHDVNVAEAAMLAALARSPTRYNPRRNPRFAVERRNLVIDLMRDNNNLTPAEAEAWKAYPLVLSSHSDYQSVAEYFVEYVRQIMQAKYGSQLYTSGLRIYTTLDLNIQQAAVDALENQLEKIESGATGKFSHQTYRDYMDKKGEDATDRTDTPYLQGAALVLEAKTGNILAMVGGRDFSDSKFNRMTQADRQPGSTFKPIVYTTAVESGVSLDDAEPDAYISVPMPDGQPDWAPHNFENHFSDSLLTLRQGLWQSKNSIAVRVGEKVGAPAVIQEARKFGITTPMPAVPSIFLGTPEVRPIEMIAAYTAFANVGSRTVPNPIVRVEDKKGNILEHSVVQTLPVLETNVASTMNQALQGVIRYGTAHSAVIGGGFTLPAGGKTGTTSDYHDVWFIGFTKDLVAGVWMGFDNPQKIMANAQGGRLAAPAWTQMMIDIYQRRPAPGDWEFPADSMVAVEVDKTNGLRATPFCPANLRETRYFVKGTEPKEFCPIHSPFRPGGAN